ncbi:hypothetical protein CSUI_008127, partial [Cystoisospora suis]
GALLHITGRDGLRSYISYLLSTYFVPRCTFLLLQRQTGGSPGRAPRLCFHVFFMDSPPYRGVTGVLLAIKPSSNSSSVQFLLGFLKALSQ